MKGSRFAASGYPLAILLLLAFFAGTAVVSIANHQKESSKDPALDANTAYELETQTVARPQVEGSLRFVSYDFVGMTNEEKSASERYLQERGAHEPYGATGADILISVAEMNGKEYLKFAGFGLERYIPYENRSLPGMRLSYILDELTAIYIEHHWKGWIDGGSLTVSDKGVVDTTIRGGLNGGAYIVTPEF